MILASLAIMWRLATIVQPSRRNVIAALTASTLLYFPLLQAYVQREFEVVLLLVVCVACWALLTRRERLAGSLLGYIVWFKLLPLAWLPYLVIRRWWGSAATFALVASATAFVTVLWLGPVAFESLKELSGWAVGQRSTASGFCADWGPEEMHRRLAQRNQTFASVPWALCNLSDRWPVLPAGMQYAGAVLGLAAVFGTAFWRLERRAPLPVDQETWRRGLEASLVIVGSTAFAYAHYYYYALFILPLNLLLARYVVEGSWRGRHAFWIATYGLLGLPVPVTLLASAFGIDAWEVYMRHAVYAAGVLGLTALLLWEYWKLSARDEAPVAMRS